MNQIPNNTNLNRNKIDISELGQSLQIKNPDMQLEHLLISLDSKTNEKENEIMQNIVINKQQREPHRIFKKISNEQTEDEMLVRIGKQNIEYELTIEKLRQKLSKQQQQMEQIMRNMANNITVIAQNQKIYYHLQSQLKQLQICKAKQRSIQEDSKKYENIQKFNLQLPKANSNNKVQINKIVNNYNNISLNISQDFIKEKKEIKNNRKITSQQLTREVYTKNKKESLSELEQQLLAFNALQSIPSEILSEEKNQFLPTSINKQHHRNPQITFDDLFQNLMPVSATQPKDSKNVSQNKVPIENKYRKVTPIVAWTQQNKTQNKNENFKKEIRRKLSEKINYKYQDKIKPNGSKQSTPSKNIINPQAVPAFSYSIRKTRHYPIFDKEKQPMGNTYGSKFGEKPSVMAVKIDVRTCK